MFYSALARGEFRLLKVNAGRGYDELHCTLEVRTLFQPIPAQETIQCSGAPDPEPYEALSYAWESNEPGHFITIIQSNQPHIVEVYPNLKAALLQLRRPDAPRYLWVDALCINQSDELEKSGQVKEMSRIYNKARGVCVWLGPERDESIRAINFIRNRLQHDDSDSLMTDADLAGDWAALSLLLRRPWFSRRWIIQEIALARSATLYCGQESIPWEIFANATSFFISGQARIRQICRVSEEFNYDPNYFGDLGESAAARLVDFTGHIFTKSDNGDILDRSLPLEELMCSLHMFQTSDPRDALYAIISIAEDARPGFKVSDGTDALVSGDILVQSPLSLSPSAVEYLAPGTLGHSHGRQRSPSLESRAGSGNLGTSALPENGRKRTLSNTRNQDFYPATRRRGNHQSSEDTYAYAGEVSAGVGRPAILLSEPDEMRPPSRLTAPVRESSRLSWGSVSSTSSLLGEPATRTARRWSKIYRDSHIPVDYTKSLYDVCRDVLDFTFKASNSLNMICRPWAPIPSDPSQRLPSWIPTMSRNAFGLAHNGVYVRVNADPLVGGPRAGQSFYRASKTSALWQFDCIAQDRPCLVVTGFELGRIETKTSPAISGVIPFDWTEIVQWTDPNRPPPEPFWKTLVGNRDAKGERAQILWKTACQQAFKLRPQHGDLNVKEAMMYDRRDYVKDYLDRVLRTVWSRRLAVLSKTAHNISLALVPRKAKKGDKVCIINGCSVPILLREAIPADVGGDDGGMDWQDGHNQRPNGRDKPRTHDAVYYEMIGECYVHGMMDGEASKYKKKHWVKDQRFCLI
ncbi:HET domain-containing protein [Aspergillus undulatus]|uniref:HET domain-containing protein n=1 Tax=Aspergillus undulatus TaxID=1810928 RepID=UPI003CCE2991